MPQIDIGAYAVSCASSLVCLGVFALLYWTTRSPLLKSYLLYLAVGLCTLAASLIGLYISSVLPLSPTVISRWHYFVETVSCGLFTYAAPRFFLEFADIDFKGAIRRVMTGASAAVMAFSPFALAEGPLPLPYLPPLLGLIAFLISMIYSQARLIGAYRRVRDRLGRIGIPAIVAYDLLCIVLGFVDSFFSGRQLATGRWPGGALLRPAIYLAWNALSLLWVARYEGSGAVARPASVEPDPARARALGVTQRELELARRLAAGEANKEIAAALGLSANTVRNHVHNLFEKTGARNRVELVRALCGADEAAER